MSWAAGVIGGIVLVLTISGLYGVLAYAVARRTKKSTSAWRSARAPAGSSV